VTKRTFLRALTEAVVVTSIATVDLQVQAEALDSATSFVEIQLAALPLLLRLGLAVGLVVFRLSVLIRFWRRFSGLALRARMAAVEIWADSRFEVCRATIRVIRNVALLAYHEELAQHDEQLASTRRSHRNAR
jgi:hypothetical protein